MLPLYRDRDWLWQRRYGEGLLLREMADLAGCSVTTIGRWLGRHGMPNRTDCGWLRIGWERGRWGAEAYRRRRLGRVHRALLDWLKPTEALALHRDPDWLQQKYVRERLTGDQVAELCGGGRNLVYQWLKVHRIPRRASASGHVGAWPRDAHGRSFSPPTSIEIETSEALDGLEIEHESQYRPAGCRWTFDEFVPPGVLVEVQGDYWHSQERTRRTDAWKARWATEHGFVLVVLWEHEIRELGARALLESRLPGCAESHDSAS